MGRQIITNSNPPEPIIMMGQSETLISSEIVLLHSFLHVHSLTASFTSRCELFNYTEPKPFWWAKSAFFWHFFIQLYSAGSIAYRAPLEMLLSSSGLQHLLSLSHVLFVDILLLHSLQHFFHRPWSPYLLNGARLFALSQSKSGSIMKEHVA